MRPAFCGVPDRQKTLRPGSLSPAVPLAGVGTHHRPAERLKPDPKACFCPIIDNQRLLLKPTTATQTWRREPLFMLRVFGRLPITDVTRYSEAGVRKASGEETAGEFAPTLVSIYGEFAAAA